MEGCINLFRAIDPGVRRIETYAGGQRDYVLLARRPRSGGALRPLRTSLRLGANLPTAMTHEAARETTTLNFVV